MSRASTGTTPPSQPQMARPRAVMRGKRHFLNQEGEAAARAGLPAISPYGAASLEHIGWHEGWTKARTLMDQQEQVE